MSDASALPPVDELERLALDELLHVLTSSLPTHKAIERVLRRRDKDQGPASVDELDPHKRVEATARNFLLRRMRRIARALEGLRDRLERPIQTREALAWRLFGPLGPRALAESLARREPEGGAFFIAEVARTVATADIRVIPPDISKAHLRAQINSLLGGLRELAAEHPAPENLADYVATSFEEISR